MRGFDFLSGVFGIHYTPKFKKICKNNTNAGLLLSQMLFYAKISDNNFYKFSEPCENNRYYQMGDSWCELLEFSKSELRLAMSILKELNFIKSRKSENFDGRTFYSVNLEVIAEAVENELQKTAINEQKQPLNAKSQAGNGKSISEREKPLKSENLVLKTERKTEKTQDNAENKGGFVLKTDKKSSLELPNFIDKDVFQDFINHRKEIKKPLTETALKALIKKLENFNAKGINANEALNTSIANGWQGVFEPQQNKQSGYKTQQERNFEVMREWALEMEAKERGEKQSDFIDLGASYE